MYLYVSVCIDMYVSIYPSPAVCMYLSVCMSVCIYVSVCMYVSISVSKITLNLRGSIDSIFEGMYFKGSYSSSGQRGRGLQAESDSLVSLQSLSDIVQNWSLYEVSTFSVSCFFFFVCLVACISRPLTREKKRGWKGKETYTILFDSLILQQNICGLLFSLGGIISSFFILPIERDEIVEMGNTTISESEMSEIRWGRYGDLSFNSDYPNIVCVLCGIINQFCFNYFIMIWVSVLIHHYSYLIKRDNALYTQKYLNRTIIYATGVSTIMTILPIIVEQNVYDVYGFNGTTCLLYEPLKRLWYVLPSLIIFLFIGMLFLPVAASRVKKGLKRTGAHIYHGQYTVTVLYFSRYADLILFAYLLVTFGSITVVEVWSYILYSKYSQQLIDTETFEEVHSSSEKIRTVTFISFIFWSNIFITCLILMSKSSFIYFFFSPSSRRFFNGDKEYLRWFGPLIELNEVIDIYEDVKELKHEKSNTSLHQNEGDLKIKLMGRNNENLLHSTIDTDKYLVKDEASVKVPVNKEGNDLTISNENQSPASFKYDQLTSTYDFYNIFCTTWNMGK